MSGFLYNLGIEISIWIKNPVEIRRKKSVFCRTKAVFTKIQENYKLEIFATISQTNNHKEPKSWDENISNTTLRYHFIPIRWTDIQQGIKIFYWQDWKNKDSHIAAENVKQYNSYMRELSIAVCNLCISHKTQTLASILKIHW